MDDHLYDEIQLLMLVPKAARDTPCGRIEALSLTFFPSRTPGEKDQEHPVLDLECDGQRYSALLTSTAKSHREFREMLLGASQHRVGSAVLHLIAAFCANLIDAHIGPKEEDENGPNGATVH